MKLRFILSIGLIAVAAHPAFAQEAKTRAQVRAELDHAIRSGDLLAPGELGVPLNQVRPDLYPRVALEPGKSRAEVKAELTEAIRTGDIIAGETSYRLNEIHPNLYPPVAVLPGKSRQEAKAELADALRTGDILAGGETSLKRNELYPWSYRDQNGTFAAKRPRPALQRGIFSLSF